MKNLDLTIRARVWEYQGEGPWHFVTIEKADADEIKKHYPWPRRGFGSIPVHVTVGSTTWKTSVFPDKGGTHILPIKRLVRERENVHKGDIITLSLTIIA